MRDYMEVRPQNWKESGWLPQFTLPERVLACILYHSWCFPVCVDYAVQLAETCPPLARQYVNDDGLVCDRYGRFVPLRVKDVARILNERQPNVSRALKRLNADQNIRIDQDQVLSPPTRLALEVLKCEDSFRCWTPTVWQELLDASFHGVIADEIKTVLGEGMPDDITTPDDAELIGYARAVCREATCRGFRPSAQAAVFLSDTLRSIFERIPNVGKLRELRSDAMATFDPQEIATWF